MIPSIGRIVIYKTTEKEREGLKAMGCYNEQKELPAVIVAVWGDTPQAAVNLKVAVDGSIPDLWKTSVNVGENEGSWHWPVIKPTISINSPTTDTTANVNTLTKE